MPAKRGGAATAHSTNRFLDVTHVAIHERVSRVRCMCGQMVDDDRLAQARHLAGTHRDEETGEETPTCRWASPEVRARAAEFVEAEVAADEPEVECEDEPEVVAVVRVGARGQTDDPRPDAGTATAVPCRGTASAMAQQGGLTARVEGRRAPSRAALSPETAEMVAVLALETAELAEVVPGPRLVRELWDLDFLDLPVEARLELRALGGEPGFLHYYACMSQYLATRQRQPDHARPA